jgi:CheY-like chemotaxis protein
MHEAMTRILNDERSHPRTLFNQALGFIAVLRGKTHVFELANEAYYQLVGHCDIIGKPVWRALPEVAGQRFEQLLDSVFQTGQPFVGRRLKITIQREPSGPLTEKYVDLLYQPIFDVNGAVTGIFAQGHDVTEAQRAWNAVERIRAEEALREADRRKDQFLAMLGHNNGIGIEKDLLPNIFDLFSQGERSSDRSQGGLGLGLSLVKSLVELHGGSVTAQSKGINGGSEFTACLPRLTTHTDELPTGYRKSELTLQAGSLRILVVDDNADAAAMLAVFLEFNGYHVTVEHDPRQPLQRATGETFDAFLLDIELPGMDGTELARRLRMMPVGRNALMMAVTGYGQHFDRRNALRAGFDFYFVKPWSHPNYLLYWRNSKKENFLTSKRPIL